MNDLVDKIKFTGEITHNDSTLINEISHAVNNQPAIDNSMFVTSINSSGESTMEQIELLLNNYYHFRFNKVSNKVEFKRKGVEEDTFEDMTDYDYNSILRFIKKENISCSITTLRMILQCSFVPVYNPYSDIETNFPVWDGQTDYIDMLANTITTTAQENWRKWFKKWYVAMVKSWVDERTVNHTALILCGVQGIGKTTWISLLIPKQLKKYVYAGNINLRDKDSQVKLSECCIIIMDELENMSRNLDALKELITKTDIYVRRAYAYTHEKFIRRASFAGSINNKDFLHDITGNRRFLCFEVTAIDMSHNVDVDMAVSQALTLANQGFQFWFDESEINELEVHNEEFRAVNAEEEQLTTYFKRCESEEEGAIFMKTTDIIRYLLNLSRFRSLSDQKLGRVLNALKFVREKYRGRYGYWLKPIIQSS